MKTDQRVKILAVYLHEKLVGYLTHYQDGTNLFHFDESYIELGSSRPTLSLSFSDEEFIEPQISQIKLPVFFSNLLPEGALRQLICEQLKMHRDDEFALLEALGDDLPGAITVKRIYDIPDLILRTQKKAIIDKEEGTHGLNFSLAGAQMKFSMKKNDGRYTISKPGKIGNYIVKTPSTIHPFVPYNEYSTMKLAESVGIDVPDVQLVNLNQLDGLPKINLPNEQDAYLIKRFDRDGDNARIHIEDFAQVFSVRNDRKYSATNYDSMAKLIHEIFPNGIAEVEKFVKRLTFNILIGNTDAHLQNWSVIYNDKITPSLSPAYDLLSTLSYIDNRELALNFAKKKAFYSITLDDLKYFAKRINVSDKIVLNAATNVIEMATELWPSLLKELHYTESMKEALKVHWNLLQSPFHGLAMKMKE